jgi:hypothetical protein
LQSRREAIFAKNTKYHKYWRAVQRSYEKMDEAGRKQADAERQFFAAHIQKYLRVLDSIPETGYY